MNLMQAALEAVGRGEYVFPLEPNGKAPLTDRRLGLLHGQDDATNDPELVRDWWVNHPDANYGINLRLSGLTVVDPDRKPGGVDGVAAWEDLRMASGAHEPTRTVRTASGALHVYFTRPDALYGMRGQLAPGIDLKHNGYVVGPGSVIDGRAYEAVDESPAADMPAWAAEKVVKPQPAAVPSGPYETGDRAAYGRLIELRDELAAEPRGGRNTAIGRAAALAGQYAGAGQLDPALIEAELGAVIDAWTVGHPRVRARDYATLRRQVEWGLANPRPWTSLFDPGFKEWTGGVVQLSEPAPARSYEDELEAALLDSDGLSLIEDATPLVKGVLNRDSLAWVYGPPGCGKSFVSLDLAGAVGTGSHWTDRGLVDQGDVLYLVAEGARGIRKRVRAWESHSGIKMSGVVFLPVAVQATDPAGWNALVALVARRRPALIVLDTQARITAGMDENSAKEMGLFVQRADALRQASGACVLVVHHTGRAGEHMRGSIALDGAADTLIAVEKSAEIVTLTCRKQKDDEEFSQIGLTLTPHGDSAVLLGGGSAGTSVPSWLAKWWELFGTDEVPQTELLETIGLGRGLYNHKRVEYVRSGLILVRSTGNRSFSRLTRDPAVPSSGVGFSASVRASALSAADADAR